MSDPLVQFKDKIIHMLHNEQDFYKSCEQALFLFEIAEPIFVGFDYAYKVVDLCKYYTDEIDNLLRAEPHHATEKKLNAIRLRFYQMSEKFHRLQHARMSA
jgi:hypothetical protein